MLWEVTLCSDVRYCSLTDQSSRLQALRDNFEDILREAILGADVRQLLPHHLRPLCVIILQCCECAAGYYSGCHLSVDLVNLQKGSRVSTTLIL